MALKSICWHGDVSREVRARSLHTLVLLQDPGKEGPEPLEVGEPLYLMCPTEENDGYLGLGEVIALKSCVIRDIEPVDLARGLPPWNTVPGVIDALKRTYEHKRTEIGRNTPVTVVTLRRNTYSLKHLNNYFKNKRAGK